MNLVDDSPIFIGGTGRSGTTIMSILLAQHPDVYAVNQELKLITEPYGLVDLIEKLSDQWGAMDADLALKQFLFFAEQLTYLGFRNRWLARLDKLTSGKLRPWLARRFPNIRYSTHPIGRGLGINHYRACIRNLSDELIYKIDDSCPLDSRGILSPYYITHKFKRSNLIQIFRNFVDRLLEPSLRFHKASRWCDDTPHNLVHVDALLELYPKMRFLHVLRDPRDIVASYCQQDWASDSVDVNAHIIKNTLDGWVALRETLPMDAYLEIRLEDLIAEPETTLRRICEFCHLPFDSAMLSVDLSKGNVGRYKQNLTPDQVLTIEEGLLPWMTEKGYVRVGSQ